MITFAKWMKTTWIFMCVQDKTIHALFTVSFTQFYIICLQVKTVFHSTQTEHTKFLSCISIAYNSGKKLCKMNNSGSRICRFFTTHTPRNNIIFIKGNQIAISHVGKWLFIQRGWAVVKRVDLKTSCLLS